MISTLSLSYRQQAGTALEKLAISLDLTERQYKDAIERYEAVGNFLAHPAGSLAIYKPRLVPQGSFRIGTVVRPDEECEFDVDTTCWLMINLPDSQYRIKQLIAFRLNADANYQRMLKEKHRCWRLVYHEATRFHLDVVPAVPDDYQWLIDLGVPERFARHAVRIRDDRHPKYKEYTKEWMGSNPEGYALWFLEVTKVQADQIRSVLSAELKMSVDSIPEYKVRTSLQRGIQLMKRHRDEKYGDDELKPISIIINTLAARSYTRVMQDPLRSNLFFDVIYEIVERMPEFIEDRQGVKWIVNPVNPRENFADKWALDKRLEREFFAWHRSFMAMLRNENPGRSYIELTAGLKDAFGERAVNRAFPADAIKPVVISPSPIRTAATLLAGGSAYTDSRGRITHEPTGMKNQEHRFHFGKPAMIPRRRDHKYGSLLFQQKLIEKHYSFLKCRIERNVLKCTGWIQPEGSSQSYKVLIEYVLGHEPKTTILEPEIDPSVHIHMYKDHSLCLSYPPDLRWTERSRVAKLTVPWVAEWLVYYELFLENGGVWEGPQSPFHLTEATRNVNVD